jgi:hypothetical protein
MKKITRHILHMGNYDGIEQTTETAGFGRE